ncbi:MAG: glycosyltransferase family 2 protein [Candidatus Omnitrophota bacterium]|nr:glycosyltransferase family 2 protein [Candidatus Omnitrophota bacterium]
MYENKKIAIIMPAYNAELTLKRTVESIPKGIVDEMILTDDCSKDKTVMVAESLGIKVFVHKINKGYGANQKTCYNEVLKTDADIVIMLHPDYQYDPRVIPFAIGFIITDICDIIVGSRIRTRREALDGGMPLYKYISNRFLTTFENFILGQNLGDFHSGFRVYKREVLEKINYIDNSDDFIFDTEFLTQAVYLGYRIGDIPIPTKYFPEASSINFRRSMRYGIQCIWVVVKFFLQRCGMLHFKLFDKNSNA